MRSSTAKITVLCTLIICSTATPIFEPIFVSLSEDYQPETKIVKRGIAYVPENTDGELKQVSLQSLIGGLEHSLFRSALSVSGIVHNKDVILPEVTPPSSEENHTPNKRHSEQIQTTDANHQVTTATTEIPKGLLLQKSEKVPPTDGSPAHILIDRVTVQDFNGALPLIPPFEVKHTQLISAKFSAGNPTEISITKTSTKSTSTIVGSSTDNPASSTTGSTTVSSSTTGVKANSESSSASPQPTTETTVSNLSKTTGSIDINSSSSTSTTAETTTTSTTTTTTKTPIVKLKEAEQELKEKVAEIEADPVILSSRI